VEPATTDRIQRTIDAEATERFPPDAVPRLMLLRREQQGAVWLEKLQVLAFGAGDRVELAGQAGLAHRSLPGPGVQIEHATPEAIGFVFAPTTRDGPYARNRSHTGTNSPAPGLGRW
jgi:hypothetical protein